MPYLGRNRVIVVLINPLNSAKYDEIFYIQYLDN